MSNITMVRLKVSLITRRSLVKFCLHVLALLFTVSVFAGLVKLGFWQLARGEEKLALQAQHQASQFIVSGRLLGDKRVWLDNKTWQGQAGYQLLVAMEVAPDQPWRLVNLGWLPQGLDRRVLPEVLPLPTGQLELQGWLRQPSDILLLGEHEPATGSDWRVQKLELAELSQWLGHELEADVLLLEQEASQVPLYPRDWRVGGTSVEKHHGYAVQWFALAFTWLVLCVVFVRKSRAQQPVSRQTKSDKTRSVVNEYSDAQQKSG